MFLGQRKTHVFPSIHAQNLAIFADYFLGPAAEWIRQDVEQSSVQFRKGKVGCSFLHGEGVCDWCIDFLDRNHTRKGHRHSALGFGVECLDASIWSKNCILRTWCCYFLIGLEILTHCTHDWCSERARRSHITNVYRPTISFMSVFCNRKKTSWPRQGEKRGRHKSSIMVKRQSPK